MKNISINGMASRDQWTQRQFFRNFYKSTGPQNQNPFKIFLGLLNPRPWTKTISSIFLQDQWTLGLVGFARGGQTKGPRTCGPKDQWTLRKMLKNLLGLVDPRISGPIDNFFKICLGLVDPRTSGICKVGYSQDQWTQVLGNPSTKRPKYIWAIGLWTQGLVDPSTGWPKYNWTQVLVGNSRA